MSTSYTALESKSIESLGVKAPTFSSDVVSLVSSTSFLWTLGITACVLAGGVIIGRGGIYSLQASEAGIRKRNEDWKRASLGLLGVFSLWLILYTLNKGLVMGDVGLEGLRIKTSQQSSNSTGTAGPVSGNPVTPAPTPTPSPTPATNGSEEANRAALGAVGITFNKAACVGGNTSCTNVGGIQQATIDMLIALKQACNCAVQVTGGTEGGHSTNSRHGVGKEAVDIGMNTQLFDFIKSKTLVSAKKYGWGGFVFWDELPGSDTSGNANSARHFHVSFTGN